MSIRQLIKRFGSFFNLTLSDLNPAVIIAPFSFQEPVADLTSSKTITQLEYYYFLYAFWRGSMRVKAATFNSDGGEAPTSTPRASNNIWNIGLINSIQDTFNSNIAIASNLEGLVEFEVPYYNVSHISPATLYTNAERPVEISNVLKGHIPPAIVTMSSRALGGFTASASAEITNAQFYRAAGDDFSLMYLVGVPPLVNVDRT